MKEAPYICGGKQTIAKHWKRMLGAMHKSVHIRKIRVIRVPINYRS